MARSMTIGISALLKGALNLAADCHFLNMPNLSVTYIKLNVLVLGDEWLV